MFYKLTNDKKKDPMKLHSFTDIRIPLLLTLSLLFLSISKTYVTIRQILFYYFTVCIIVSPLMINGTATLA